MHYGLTPNEYREKVGIEAGLPYGGAKLRGSSIGAGEVQRAREEGCTCQGCKKVRKAEGLNLSAISSANAVKARQERDPRLLTLRGCGQGYVSFFAMWRLQVGYCTSQEPPFNKRSAKQPAAQYGAKPSACTIGRKASLEVFLRQKWLGGIAILQGLYEQDLIDRKNMIVLLNMS